MERMDLESGYAGLNKGVFCLFDRLEISWMNNKSIVLCGHWPESSLPGPFRINSREVKLDFATDGSVQRAGFRMKVTCANLNQCCSGHESLWRSSSTLVIQQNMLAFFAGKNEKPGISVVNVTHKLFMPFPPRLRFLARATLRIENTVLCTVTHYNNF